jgi:hypothetical protein
VSGLGIDIGFALKQVAARGARHVLDVPKVVDYERKRTRKVLSKFGSFVRQRAKTSLRKKRKKARGQTISQPGKPPVSHTDLVKKLILFDYDDGRRSVVIGPIKIRKPDPDALEMLEHGGITRRRRRRGGRTKQVTAFYRARPFMGPALAKELPKLPAMWRSVN